MPRRNPSQHDASTHEPSEGNEIRAPRKKWWPWMVGIAAIATFVVLHFTGVLGIGSHQ
jgi:hypothetical protein